MSVLDIEEASLLTRAVEMTLKQFAASDHGRVRAYLAARTQQGLAACVAVGGENVKIPRISVAEAPRGISGRWPDGSPPAWDPAAERRAAAARAAADAGDAAPTTDAAIRAPARSDGPGPADAANDRRSAAANGSAAGSRGPTEAPAAAAARARRPDADAQEARSEGQGQEARPDEGPARADAVRPRPDFRTRVLRDFEVQATDTVAESAILLAARELVETIVDEVPECRELSLAITHLEEALMWVRKAIERA